MHDGQVQHVGALLMGSFVEVWWRGLLWGAHVLGGSCMGLEEFSVGLKELWDTAGRCHSSQFILFWWGDLMHLVLPQGNVAASGYAPAEGTWNTAQTAGASLGGRPDSPSLDPLNAMQEGQRLDGQPSETNSADPFLTPRPSPPAMPPASTGGWTALRGHRRSLVASVGAPANDQGAAPGSKTVLGSDIGSRTPLVASKRPSPPPLARDIGAVANDEDGDDVANKEQPRSLFRLRLPLFTKMKKSPGVNAAVMPEEEFFQWKAKRLDTFFAVAMLFSYILAAFLLFFIPWMMYGRD